MSGLFLEDIHPGLREMAVADLDAGDVLGFLSRAAGGNQFWLRIVSDNVRALQARGLYEAALLEAWESCRANHSAWTTNEIRYLFRIADRARLLALAPLPGPGPFTLYRGVAGQAPRRRVRGFSWTDDLEKAWWFARRFELADPAVYRTAVPAEAVLAFIGDRDEREFVIFPPSKVTRLRAGAPSLKDQEAEAP